MSEAYEYLAEGIIRACMRCQPGDTIFELHPEWRGLGLSVSHGVCPECNDAMRAELGLKPRTEKHNT